MAAAPRPVDASGTPRAIDARRRRWLLAGQGIGDKGGLTDQENSSRAPGNVFSAEGNPGQMLVVDRARDLVVGHLTDHRRWLRRGVEVPRISPVLERVIAAAPAA